MPLLINPVAMPTSGTSASAVGIVSASGPANTANSGTVQVEVQTYPDYRNAIDYLRGRMAISNSDWSLYFASGTSFDNQISSGRYKLPAGSGYQPGRNGLRLTNAAASLLLLRVEFATFASADGSLALTTLWVNANVTSGVSPASGSGPSIVGSPFAAPGFSDGSGPTPDQRAGHNENVYRTLFPSYIFPGR